MIMNLGLYDIRVASGRPTTDKWIIMGKISPAPFVVLGDLSTY